jgi:site-specific recombinase XerD
MAARPSSPLSAVARWPKSFHTLIARLGERAKMPFPIHPHMLRHAYGDSTGELISEDPDLSH